MFISTPAVAKSSFKVDKKGFETSEAHILKVFGQNRINDDHLIVTVNRFCNLGKSFLTENLSLKKKNKLYSAQETYRVPLQEPLTIDELESIAQYDDCVVDVSKDITVRLFETPSDTKFSKQTHLKAIKYEETFNFFNQMNISKDAVIAIIDNGVDVNHDDLKNNIWTNTKEKNGLLGFDDDNNGLVDDIYGYDFMEKVGDPNHKYTDTAPVNSHGTHVAALAAATTNNSLGVAGVASKNVKIMALNVFGKKQFSDFAVIDTAIRYAADMGANVINMSLGGKGFSSSTEKAILYAVSKKVLVVVAAGNSGEVLTDTNFYSPASYGAGIDGMVAVGAVDTGNKFGELCSFSNRSTQYVEISAPGCHVIFGASGLFSAFKNNQYGYMAGTSMASPIAAGVAAVAYNYLKTIKKKITPSDLEEFLKNSSRASPLLESDIQEGKTVDLQALKDKIISP